MEIQSAYSTRSEEVAYHRKLFKADDRDDLPYLSVRCTRESFIDYVGELRAMFCPSVLRDG